MKLSEFFAKAKTKNIVINTDIDGFLSGMILQKYYGCKVVGFSNSSESIWLSPEITSIFEPVYIDIFVNHPQVFCIDQHIVAYDDAHLDQIVAQGTKMNPNLDILRKSYTNDYYHKYPFGTVHYLIALMKLDGIDVAFHDLTKNQTITGADGRAYTTCPGQIILRADDALFSSLGRYKDNADIWWNDMKKFGSDTINKLHTYLMSLEPNCNWIYKDNIGEFFVSGLRCDGKDGAFHTITGVGQKLHDRVWIYNNIIGQIVGMQMTLPAELCEYRGVARRDFYSKEKLDAADTYAFIYSPVGKYASQSFSYTTDIERKNFL